MLTSSSGIPCWRQKDTGPKDWKTEDITWFVRGTPKALHFPLFFGRIFSVSYISNQIYLIIDFLSTF